MRTFSKLACTGAVLAALLFWGGGAHARAQAPIENNWEPSFKVSQVPSTMGVNGVLLAGDSQGNVYVIWPGSSRGAGTSPDTIYFRMRDATRWMNAVEIIAYPQADASLFALDLAVDAYGRLALLWTRGRELYLSTADPASALRASGWRTSRLLGSAGSWGAALATTPDGGLHVLAANDGQDLTYIESVDAGRSWVIRATITSTDDPIVQVSDPRLIIAPDGVVHLTWTEYTPANNWTGKSIMYSQSADKGKSFSDPARVFTISGCGRSTLAADGKGNVLLYWNRSVGSKDGRYFARSNNNGRIWTSPTVPFGGISGMNRSAELLWDGAGILYLMNSGEGPQSTEVWQSIWLGDRWQAPVAAEVQNKGTGTEIFDAAIVGGNRMILVWVDYNTRDVYYSSKPLPAPATPDKFLSLPEPTATPAATVAPLPTVGPTRTPFPTRVASQGGEQAADPIGTTWVPLLAGILPVVGILALLLFARARFR